MQHYNITLENDFINKKNKQRKILNFDKIIHHFNIIKLTHK